MLTEVSEMQIIVLEYYSMFGQESLTDGATSFTALQGQVNPPLSKPWLVRYRTISVFSISPNEGLATTNSITSYQMSQNEALFSSKTLTLRSINGCKRAKMGMAAFPS